MCACGSLCLALRTRYTHTVELSTSVAVSAWSRPGADTNKRAGDKKNRKFLFYSKFKTFNNGSLGSRIDEERSELRYVMRIAASVKHRIFERTLRPPALRGACLSERRFLSQRLLVVGGTSCEVSLKVRSWGRFRCAGPLGTTAAVPGAGASSDVLSKLGCMCIFRSPTFGTKHCPRPARAVSCAALSLTSDQVGLPAELKHINKRRKRNQPGLPQ